MPLSAAETETIGLCIVIEALNDLVNHAVLDLEVAVTNPRAATVAFPTHVHRDLFLVRLLDFSKEAGASKLTGVEGSCLDVLAAACKSRAFDRDGSIQYLQRATQELRDWMDAVRPYKLWLPTLGVEVTLNVARHKFLLIAGNQAKHNVSRLTGVADQIASMLNQHGHHFTLQQVALALDDFSEFLHADYFVYYGSWLAELLNEIRWGLHCYLTPIFTESFQKLDDVMYRYVFPPEISDKIAQDWFWRLMNHCRARPYVPRFTVRSSFKDEVIRAEEM